MAKTRARTRFTPRLISVAVAACFATSAAFANPTGPTVVNGTASFQQTANLLQITNSPNAIINWQSFSIGASEITRFLQQSASSAVLNRVIAQNPSSILGALQSNGRVFLINPNGILFGAGAQIDVAGLVASTLNLSNADFLAGRLKFTEVPGAGSVVNQGTINAAQGGQVYLVGPSVTNSGVITTPKGEVILAAGNSVELVNPGTPNLRVEITAPDNEAINLGQIVADSGRVGIYAGLINHSGTIRADSAVATEDGRIVLAATKHVTLDVGSVTTANGPTGGSITVQSGDTTLVSGAIEAKGTEGKGGTVQVLGNLVGLIDNASIDASGNTGGGTVLVGGDFQGKNPDVQNAFRTYVGSNTMITADAVVSGDGGKVIVWSDDATRFYGNISARGGAQSGNGGFAEVSGKNWLDYQGLADLRAPNGQVGTLLLDPAADLEIGAAADILAGGNLVGGIFSGASGTAQITWATIDGALDLSNVIGTTSGTGGSGNATIVSDSPDLATPNMLRLLANNDATINGIVTNTGTGALEVYAGWDGLSTSAPTVTAGVGTINVNRSVSTGGNVTAVAGNDINVGSAASLFPRVVTAGGMMTVTAGDTLTLQGGMGVGVAGCVSCARLTSAGGQAISAANITLIGGSGDHSFADIRQTGAGATQVITLTGSTLTLQGGSGGPDNFARIRNEGTSQQINFPSTGGTIALTGGTGTSNNAARIQALTGTQSIGSPTGRPSITLIGGASGGVADDGNVAAIIAHAGTQTITAGNTTLTAGAGGQNNSAVILGPNQIIDIASDLVLTGGGSAPTANNGGGSRVGGLSPTTLGGPTPTNLMLTVNGNVTMNGGSVVNAGSAIGSNILGGQTTDITMTVGGNVTLNPGSVSGSRIGSPSSSIAGGDISVSAGGSIALNSSGAVGTAIRTTGDVHLVSDFGITQGAASPVTANKLLADGGEGAVLLDLATNMVSTLAGSATGEFRFKNGQSLEIGTVTPVSGVPVSGVTVSGNSPATVNINVTSGNLTVNKNMSATATGSSNSASVALTASAGSITVNNSTISANGASGTPMALLDVGGSATVTLNAGTGITLNSSTVRATGGNGTCCGGGSANGASVSLMTTSGGITLNTSNITATGGNGSSGGSASVSLNAGTGSIQINASTIRAQGGVGDGSFSGGGGASVTLTGNGITVGSGSTISAVGGAGVGPSGFFGGFANVTLDGGAGSITVAGATISATGGNGPSFGGGAFVSLNAGGDISVASTVSAIGGAGSSQGSASVTITSNNGDVTTGANITAEGGGDGAFVEVAAPNGSIQSTGGFLKAVGSTVNLTAKNGIGTLANPVRIFDDQPDVFATNMTSGAVVLSQINNNVVIDDGALGIMNNAPGGLIAGFAESGNLTIASVINKPGNALLLSGVSGLTVNNGANVTADTLTLQTTSPGAAISLGNAQLSAVKTGLPVSTPALVVQATAGGDVLSSANMSTASGELMITGRHVDLDVMGLGRTLTSGGDVTITASGRLSANNFLPASAFVNIQGTDIMLTSGTDAALGGQRFIALGHGAGRGNLTATSGPINVNAGTSFGGCVVFPDCYQGTVQADASNISITTGTFFATSGDVRAPAGNITINTGPTGLFIGDFANMQSSQVNAGMNLTVNAGQVVLQGGSGANAFAELRGGPGTFNVTTTGDVLVNGGNGNGSFARIFGDPDVNMTVGGMIAMNAGNGNGAFARIESASPSSITITFPNLTSGGFFVTPPGGEPVEGAVSIGSSGFFAGGSPAVLGQNLVVTYGLVSLPQEVPPELQVVINQVVVANQQNTDVLADQLRGGEAGEGAPDDKKKELPVCR